MKKKILKRKRIENELINIFDYPLTIVSATMGYGKTTAVRTYLNRKKNINTIWIPLMDSDNDELIFWNKLSSSLKTLYADAGIMLERLGFPSDANKSSKIIEIFQNLSPATPTILLIDDYHIVEHSKNLNKFIESLVSKEISHLHILLISRTIPDFNHSNLLSKHLCYYIDNSKLAFTLEETKEYIEYTGNTNLIDDIQQIHTHTNGWISAIYLILLGYEQGISITSSYDINQLVEDNLYASLDKNVQEILLNLSVLDSFTLKQAIAILDSNQVTDIIKNLMHKNAFIEFDKQNKHYKFHNVLLDFLREKVKSDGWDTKPVCLNAGKWFIANNDDLAAFDYYYRASKIEELLEYLNSIKKLNIGYFLGVDLFKKIYNELPTEVYIKYPFPLLRIAFSFILSGNPDDALQCEEIITALKNYYSSDNTIPELSNRILGEIEIINIFRVFNNAQKMVELSIKAENLLDGNVSFLVFRNNEFTFGVPHFLYAYYREVGKLKQTVTCIENGFPPKVFDGCGTGCEYIALAEYHLETGNIKNAEILAKKAIYKAKTMNQTGIILCAYFTLMRIYIFKGDISSAKKLSPTIRELWVINPPHSISPQNSVVYNLTMDMFEGYLYSTLNILELVPKWLQTGEFPFENLMMQGLAFPYIIYTKSVLLSQNWIKLEVLCETLESKYNIYHNQLGLLHNTIYAAIAKYNLYGTKEGILTLKNALLAAQIDNILLPFAENAPFILDMLYEIQSEGENEIYSLYLDKIIQMSKKYDKILKTNCTTIPLTKRELEVLELTAKGFTNKEMASNLCISIASIKKHLENIYLKLQVNNKINAVQKAKDEKLI